MSAAEGWDDPDADDVIERTQEAINEATKPAPFPPPQSPMPVARELIRRHHNHGEGGEKVLTLRWWRGDWYQWRAGRWVETEERSVRADAYNRLDRVVYIDDKGEHDWAPNTFKVRNLLEALAAQVHTAQAIAPPVWLVPRPGDQPASELVAVANGMVHVPTRSLREHSPRFFNLTAVPFDFDPDAAAPGQWLTFLDQLWPDDPDAIAALQEWFGYVVSGVTTMHKILFVIGPLRSGKGTIARVLGALIGRANMAGPTLASLGTNFGLQELVGKSLAVIADARLGTANSNVVVERRLSISGEDTLTIDRKYKDPWTGQLGTRVMILSNELPSFGDASGAIASRFVLLSLSKSWLGAEDHQLTARLLHELPGMMNWALDGLDRLHRQDRFTEPESSKDAVRALADVVSPISAFVRDRCERGPAHEVEVDALYQAWRSWCDDEGRDRPGTKAAFGKMLRAAVPGVSKRRPRSGGDERRQVYAGLALHKQWPVTVTNRDQAPDATSLAGPVTSPVTAAEPQKPCSEALVTAGHSKTPLWAQGGTCTGCARPLATSAHGAASLCSGCAVGATK